MPFGQERARQRDRPRAIAGNEHPGQPWMQGKPVHLASQWCQRDTFNRAKLTKQCKARRKRVGSGRIEPVHLTRISAPGQHVEQGTGQIDTMNLRFAVRPQPVGFVPEPAYYSWAEPSGAAGPLIGGVARNPLRFEAVDGAFRIVAGHFVYACVDHRCHAGHGQRCFRDVRREDDPPSRDSRYGAILLRAVQGSVQYDDLDIRAGRLVNLGRRPPNLRCARQEAQHLARG